VSCLSADTFAEELIAAMQEDGVARWRARIRAADVFVLDDVHQLADKERTQEELFHLFNHLYDRGSQIVLTSDRPPRELTGLADRLRSRFEGGLVVAMQPPDRALRERLVQRYLLEAGQEPSQALVALLADWDVSSFRELSGLMTRLLAASGLHNRPLTVDLARRELGLPAHTPAFTPRAPALERADNFFLDAEKTIWDWPDVAGRLIEEMR
jgi:chromosomal replication initiator protein